MIRRTKKSVLLLLMLVMIMTIFISCNKEVKTSLSPAEHVTEGIFKIAEQRNLDISTQVNLNMNYEDIIKNFPDDGISQDMVNLMNNFSLNMDYQIVTDNPEKPFDFFMNYDINYKSSPLMSLEMIMNSEVFGMGITNFYDHYFTLNFKSLFDELVPAESKDAIAKFDFQKYIKIMTDTESEEYKKVVDHDRYKDLIVKHLESTLEEGVNEEITYNANGKEITEQVISYNYNFTIESYFEFYKSLMNELKTDEEAKTYIEYMANLLVNEFISSKDYELFDLTEEDVVAIKFALESEFDAGWDEMFAAYEEAFASLDGEMSSLDDENMKAITDIYDNMTFKLSINKDGLIRALNMDIDYQGIGVKMVYTINAVGSDVVIPSKEDKYIDLMQFVNFENPDELKNTEELATIIKDFLLSSINELVEGEGFAALLVDLKPFEEELGMDVSTMMTYLEMGKVYLTNMDSEELISIIEDGLLGLTDMGGYSDDYSDEEYSDVGFGYDLVIDNMSLIVTDDSEENDAIWNSVELYSSLFDAQADLYVSTEETVFYDIQNAVDSGADIIYINGEILGDPTVTFANLYPEIQFVYFGDTLYHEESNIIIVDFYNEEAAYIAGYIAALTSDSGSIAFVGNYQDDYTMNYEIAYTDGALAANENIIVTSRYTESDEDFDLGVTMGQELASDDIDVIYHAAGETGKGLMSAAEANNYKVIGNESSYGEDLTGYITATLRDYDYIINDIIEYSTYGVTSDYYYYGIYGDALYLPDGNMTPEIAEMKNTLVEQISNGELIIP